jgi:hypothetical protein
MKHLSIGKVFQINSVETKEVHKNLYIVRTFSIVFLRHFQKLSITSRTYESIIKAFFIIFKSFNL